MSRFGGFISLVGGLAVLAGYLSSYIEPIKFLGDYFLIPAGAAVAVFGGIVAMMAKSY